jgi:hypothetical protein
MCRLCPIWIGCQRCPPRKEELRGRGSNSISNFHHHNINGGAVDNAWGTILGKSNIYSILETGSQHIYLMSRLSLQVFYLWHLVLSTAPPFILWWSNLEILFAPLHRSSPFIGGLRCQAIETEHGPYIAERTQHAIYILWDIYGSQWRTLNSE